jgi:hypothetical protein
MIGRIVDHAAPAERLAALRIVVGVFVVVYLVGRSPVFLALADRPTDDFDPVGLLVPFAAAPGGAIVITALVVTLAAGIAATIGYRYRPAAMVFAGGLSFLTTLRSSWGQLLHFENLMVLQLVVLACAPASDVWSLDARRSTRTGRPGPIEPSTRYGWPLAVASLVMVITYVIAGAAKLRYGGIDWLDGETLRNHVAYSAARLDLIGGNPPLLAELVVEHAWILAPAAFVAVAIELAAPIVFIGPRWRNSWVAAAWLMHVGILATMSVGFPSPLFGVAFAPLFPLERFVRSTRRWIERRRPFRSVAAS